MFAENSEVFVVAVQAQPVVQFALAQFAVAFVSVARGQFKPAFCILKLVVVDNQRRLAVIKIRIGIDVFVDVTILAVEVVEQEVLYFRKLGAAMQQRE